MELIDRIIDAERRAEAIRRAGEEEAEALLSAARAEAERSDRAFAQSAQGMDRGQTERLATLRGEWRVRAQKIADAERKDAEARLSEAVAYILQGVLKGAT